MAKDYYRTLGIDKNANEKDIKKAFRRLAKQYHPDANPTNPSAEAKFKEINEAYETLGNPEKRKLYDQFGADYASINNAGGAGGAGGGFRQTAQEVRFEDSQFQDIFESLFGGFGRNPNRQNQNPSGGVRKVRGNDITEEVVITLQEAYEGAMRYVESATRKSKVAIPKGATDGTKVRVKGEGEAGRMGGEAGDLYLVVKVEPDKQFTRDGDNLIVDVTCDMFTALLGGEVDVPTMNRPIRIKVAAGTQSGQKLRLAGKGMPKMRTEGEYGDLFARILITVPKNLNDTQRRLAEQLKEAMG
ncbi:MAG: J domain-containing protein [bacterium]|nr:J domain-containing protein [bacterium]